MRQIIEAIAPHLKELGFRKRRHSFNRLVSDRLTHVVSLQMGASDPPGTVEIPGLRPNLHGRFTVNFGVHSSEMNRTNPRRLSWINEYNCQLRQRLGELLPEQSDVWWRLDHRDAADDVTAAILGVGMGWLDQFRSNGDIWTHFEQGGFERVGMPPAAALDIADLYEAHGRHEDARRVLTDYSRAPHHPAHVGHLRGFLEERGYHDLASHLEQVEVEERTGP